MSLDSHDEERYARAAKCKTAKEKLVAMGPGYIDGSEQEKLSKMLDNEVQHNISFPQFAGKWVRGDFHLNNGIRIYFRWTSYDLPMLTIGVSEPGNSEASFWDTHRPKSINVSLTRTWEAIQADIQRRIVPPLMQYDQEIDERLRARQKYEDDRALFWQRVKENLDAQHRDTPLEHQTFVLYDEKKQSRAEIESGTTFNLVDVKFDNLSFAQFARIAKAWKEG